MAERDVARHLVHGPRGSLGIEHGIDVSFLSAFYPFF